MTSLRFSRIKETWEVPKSQAKVGDIVLTNKIIVSPDNWDKVNKNIYEPIGIVCIPASHMEDGKLRIVSLDFMDYNNPETGSVNGNYMVWGASGAIPNLNYYTQVPNLFENNQLTDEIQKTSELLRIPSDNFINRESNYKNAKYYNSESDSTYLGAPYPYLNDESINPQYRATSYTIPGTTTVSVISNPLSDFNGEYNTNQIMQLCTVDTLINSSNTGNYPAAQCCSLYNKGNLKWYLPSCGELGYIIAKQASIQISRNLFNYSPKLSSYYFWSSTLYSSTNARNVYGFNGNVSINSRSTQYTSYRVLAVSAF